MPVVPKKDIPQTLPAIFSHIPPIICLRVPPFLYRPVPLFAKFTGLRLPVPPEFSAVARKK
jgi:hypothetical protein